MPPFYMSPINLNIPRYKEPIVVIIVMERKRNVIESYIKVLVDREVLDIYFEFNCEFLYIYVEFLDIHSIYNSEFTDINLRMEIDEY